MTKAQQKALRRHRKNNKKQGLMRVEVWATDVDAVLIRQLASALRHDRDKAAGLRASLHAQLSDPTRSLALKTLLTAPIGG